MNGHGQRLGQFFTSRREKGHAGLPTLSVTLDRGLVRRDSLDRKTDTNLSPEEHLLVRRGDIAYNMMRMWQGASGLAYEDGLISPAYVVLSPKRNVDPAYAAYLFKSPEMIHRFWAYSYGLTNDRLRLYFPDFKRVPADIPPLPEQREIADIFSTWDRAIEVAEALLANARDQKRGLMQALLTGKRRFPEFEAQEWREVRLGDVAEVDRRSLGSSTAPEFEFRYISLSNVAPGHIVEPLATVHYADAPSRARRVVSEGDLLLSTVRPNLLGFARIAPEYADCIASTGFAVVSPGPDVDGSFLFHSLFSRGMKAQFHALVVGSNYPAVNSSDVRKLRVKLPAIEEQRRIGTVLDQCDGEVALLMNQITSFRAEKEALMQQLLTGKRLVVVDDGATGNRRQPEHVAS